MIDKTIRNEILRRIHAAEEEHQVRILYAVESGSRAWGFASANSDYDVRFIYAHPRDWYLDIDLEHKRDVIEYPIVDEIDINGWDLRKALKLLQNSNPAMVEWLFSPVVYVDDGRFADSGRALLSKVYSTARGIYHYRSMALSNYRAYLRRDVVPLKKYFYVLRPLFAVQWIEQKNETSPILFETLRSIAREETEVQQEIDRLLERKRLSTEKEHIPMVPVINNYIESELQRLEAFRGNTPDRKRYSEELNALFRTTLQDGWSLS